MVTWYTIAGAYLFTVFLMFVIGKPLMNIAMWYTDKYLDYMNGDHDHETKADWEKHVGTYRVMLNWCSVFWPIGIPIVAVLIAIVVSIVWIQRCLIPGLSRLANGEMFVNFQNILYRRAVGELKDDD